MLIRILALGDVVGPEACGALCRKLWTIREEYRADMAVVNAENACVGNGLDSTSATELLAAGADVLTSGNHIWHKKCIRQFLQTHDRVLRPANYPPEAPGSGYTAVDIDGYRVMVINVLGTVFMDALDCPFRTVDRILNHEKDNYDIAVLDIHAEATGEKLAVARCFAGRLSAVWGTHTHCPTADERILPGGTGFLTDLGMTGPENSILGVKNEIIIEKMVSKLPIRYEVADGNITASGAVFTIDTDTRKTVSVEGIRNYAL